MSAWSRFRAFCRASALMAVYRPALWAEKLAVILVNGWLCHLFLMQSRWVVSRLGSTGTKVVTKLMGLILAAVAMQFLINGVKGVAAEIRNPEVIAPS